MARVRVAGTGDLPAGEGRAIDAGGRLALWGLVKKMVVADNLAPIADRGFAANASGAVAVLGLSGCATVPLSDHEAAVRILRASDPPAACRELGRVHAPGLVFRRIREFSASPDRTPRR